MLFQFVEGDVICKPDDQRRPYGTVVYVPRPGYSDGPCSSYLVQVFEPAPTSKSPWDTVVKKSLDEYIALPSAVRDRAGRVRDTPQSRAARGLITDPLALTKNLRRAGFPDRPVENRVVATPTLFDLADDESPWG